MPDEWTCEWNEPWGNWISTAVPSHKRALTEESAGSSSQVRVAEGSGGTQSVAKGERKGHAKGQGGKAAP